MKKKPKYERTVIHSEDEIPDHFESEDAERDWWATHELSEELWDALEDTSVRTASS